MDDTTPASSGTGTTDGAEVGADGATDDSKLLPTAVVTRSAGTVPVFALRRSNPAPADGGLAPRSTSGDGSLAIVKRDTSPSVSEGAGAIERGSGESAVGI